MLKKIKVTTGVYWIEVPEANVYVLCGAPADVVKHLMRRGLIVETEENEVTFETGPNAILLSDVMVQGGNLSNLGEFPVLQMLYRQGMILPNHPNNKGLKPLIMGDPTQVKAQMSYIYRGNYGLVSEEEIIETGLHPIVAKELMQMKLKFAFGQISEPTNLLDQKVISTKPEEIRNGVSIRRVGFNCYEFSYDGKNVEVDMNLKPGETYESPYPLGYYQIKRDYFSIIHSGEGDGWDINRPTLSSVISFRGEIYLVDAGPNLDAILISLGIGINEIKGIFHTHTHDDHFAGLTTLIRSDHKIAYLATAQVRAATMKKLAPLLSIDEKEFDHFFDVHDLDLDTWNDIDGLEVKPMLSPHPVETNIFLFRSLGEEGYRSYAHYADIASFNVLEGMVTDEKDAHGISRDMFDRFKADYLQAADLKKLDIGGGMIHGEAIDFKDDESTKIVLGHISRPLSSDEKRIGSGAPFGTGDILIPAYQRYSWRFAFRYLREYFPDVSPHKLQPLLNNPVETFNPESILIREGETNDNIYIILFGNVESVDPDTSIAKTHSAGTFIGELSALHGLPSVETYRASSFVDVLRIPCQMFLEFVRKNDIFAQMSMLEEYREFLQKTWLFYEAISYPMQNRVAKTMRLLSFDPGTRITLSVEDGLAIIKKGKVERISGSETMEILEEHDVFGEDNAFFKTSYDMEIRALTSTDIFFISKDILEPIPVVRWKLSEIYEKRMRRFENMVYVY